ncbi:MAG: hypothetical protein RR199_07280, partial [Alistipes sp.]
MKNIFKSLLIVGVLFAAIGCSQDQIVTEFDPSGENPAAAYFTQKSVSQEFGSTLTGNQKIFVDVYRQSNVGDLSIGINMIVPDDAYSVFSIPENLTFKDGEFKAVLEITALEVDKFAKGTTYTAKISVGDYHEFKDVVLSKPGKAAKAVKRDVSIPHFTSITISTSLALDWQPAYILKDPSKLLDKNLTEADYKTGADGKPMVQTAAWNNFWGMKSNFEGLTVQRAAGTTVFRLLNCGDGGVNLIFMVDPDEANKVTFRGEKYFRCVFTEQFAGVLYEGADDVHIVDFPSYSGGKVTYDQAPCFWDGASDFAFSLYWMVPALGGGFNNPGDGLTDIFSFSTGVAPDPEPEAEITYVGLSTTELGVKTHSIKFEPNNDAATYYATVITEDPRTKIDPKAIIEIVKKFLADNGIKTSDPKYGEYMQHYFDIEVQKALEEQDALYITFLEKIRAEIEAGTYKGPFPVLKRDKASTDAWELGAQSGLMTAVAFSYSKEVGADKKIFKGIDYTAFMYNPDGDIDEMPRYEIIFGAGEDYADFSAGYFGDNSLLFVCQAEGGLTAVKYALMTKADFDAAQFADRDAAKAYVDKNGKALSAADMKKANGGADGQEPFSLFFRAKADTEYMLIVCVSDPDATEVRVIGAKTTAAETPKALTCALSLKENLESNKFKHTHVFAEFKGTHILGGSYVMLDVNAKDGIGNFLTIAADGSVTLKAGVTDADIISLIEGNGDKFSSGNDESDLAAMNNGETASVFLKGIPETRMIVLACADQDGKGAKKWTSAVIKSDFAPAVKFTQTVVAKGKNIEFNWKSAAKLPSIFRISKVDYALVPQSALVDAGVDMTKLTDLNDFEARRVATPADKSKIDAQEKNATKIKEVLSAHLKSLVNDAVLPINSTAGVTKQFVNMASGDYVLIGLAY